MNCISLYNYETKRTFKIKKRRNGNQTGTEETEAESLNGCGGSGRAGREGAAERTAAE